MENKEDLITQYISQELSEDEGQISIEVEENEDDQKKLNIEIIRVELSGDTDYIYTSFHRGLSPLALAQIQSALMNGDHSLLNSHLDNLVKKEGNKIEVEEETAIYKYHIIFDLNNEVDQISNIGEKLDKCILIFYESLEDDEGFLEF